LVAIQLDFEVTANISAGMYNDRQQYIFQRGTDHNCNF